MTTATIPRPLSFAGAPPSAWAFGVRIWVAVVAALAALAKATVPGPLNLVHALVTTAPVGRPSSVTDPFSGAAAGSVIGAFVPAFTVGAWFVGGVTTAGFTVIVTSAKADSNESLAVSRNTYGPA